MNLEPLYQKHENTSPTVNPIRYRYNRNYKNIWYPLGEGGKLYWKRGRMNDGRIIKKDAKPYYAVPTAWESPFGFDHDAKCCWKTDSEILAIRHYREYRNAQNKLRKRFDPIIEKQDRLYELSKSVKSNCPLPKGLKDTFEPRDHQTVAIEFGNLTNGCFMICDQQRVGKSGAALLYALSQDWNKILIVCPSKVCPIWERMVAMMCHVPTKILKTGGQLGNDMITICSYDTLHTIEDLSCCIAIADEAHFFLEANARRSSAVNRINAPKRLALSGTPTMDKADDMVSILKWLNPELAIEMQLLLDSLYGKELYEVAKIMGEELKRRCLLLRETHQVGTSITPFVNYIDIPGEVKNPKDIQEIGRIKAMYAIEYIKSFQNKMLVIFHHRSTGDQLKARLGNEAVLVNGETSKQDIKSALERFEKGEVRVLLGSSILAEGVDLSHASHLLVVEESHYSLRSDQLRERCNNIFKQEEVLIDILRLKNCQDDRVYDLINNKYTINQGLRDG